MSNTNPFVLPGLGQDSNLSGNPLLASMEMMRQAWQNLASSGALTQPPVSAGLTTEDLDRRISDLRAVENWLRINMSMLTSSIQALEVQRATIATLKSFAGVPGVSPESADNPSPLEVVLGIKPSGQAKIRTPASKREESAPEPSAQASDPAEESAGAAAQPNPAAMSEAAQGWWNMLQNQFDTLAAATVAGMQSVQPAASAGENVASGAASAPRKRARKAAPAKSATATRTRASAAKKAVKSPRKRAAR